MNSAPSLGIVNAVAGYIGGPVRPAPAPTNLAAPLKLAPMQRLWSWLGFGLRPPTPSNMEDDPRYAPGALVTIVRTELDWADRLRVLISGRVVTQTRTVTDVPIGVAISRSSFSIGRPGEPL